MHRRFLLRSLAASCGAITAASFGLNSLASADGKCRRTNLVLGDENVPAHKRKHKVGLAAWTHSEAKLGSLAALFDHAKSAGYDGLEASIGDLRMIYYNNDKSVSDETIIAEVKKQRKRTGIEVFGALYLVVDAWAATEKPRDFDPDLTDPYFEQKLRHAIRQDKKMGCEYITFQICLPPRYLNTGGAYRDDDVYIAMTAARIATMQRICFSEDVNCYVETHVDRISEDLSGFVKILEHPNCPKDLEVNGDLSHYIYRGWTKGEHVQKILAKLGHTHQRMARTHGDLSSDVKNCRKDWDEGGVTKQAFDFVEGALKEGLSSRVIVGEAGPIHLVEDCLALDAKLVPLFKYMACVADGDCSSSDGKNPFA